MSRYTLVLSWTFERPMRVPEWCYSVATEWPGVESSGVRGDKCMLAALNHLQMLVKKLESIQASCDVGLRVQVFGSTVPSR